MTDEIVERALALDVPRSVGFEHVRGLRRVDPLDDRAAKRLLRA